MKYDERHGGPYDRGAADAYYGRLYSPHYFKSGTYRSPKVEISNMSKAQIEAYTAGYRESETTKDWE